MTVYVEKADLTYVSVPKCACSTVKRFCYEVNTGKPFEIGPDGKMVHDIYLTLTFPQLERAVNNGKLGGDLIAVLRHPVDRIVSCYMDKVIRVNSIAEKREEEAKARDLPAKPDLATFISNLEAYREISPMIKSHSNPLGLYLGSDPKYFARFFGMGEIDELRQMINARAGTSVETQLHVNSSAHVSPPAVTPEIRANIEKQFAEELETFGAYFPASKVAS